MVVATWQIVDMVRHIQGILHISAVEVVIWSPTKRREAKDIPKVRARSEVSKARVMWRASAYQKSIMWYKLKQGLI